MKRAKRRIPPASTDDSRSSAYDQFESLMKRLLRVPKEDIKREEERARREKAQ